MSVIAAGNCLKMETSLNQGMAQYHLVLGSHSIYLNELVGRKVKLTFTGQINCIETGELIKKTYGQGYSYKAFITLAACDMCILRPEQCHYHLGTCREPEWGLKNCFQPHVVYLSETSDLKVGISRKVNIPHRWIDQGAVQAIELFQVETRLLAGQHEIKLAKLISDKTDWRKMLKKKSAELDLLAEKKKLLDQYQTIKNEWPSSVEIKSTNLYTIGYPQVSFLEKVSSFSFDKERVIDGKLVGIKGQYLIFEHGVVNLRKHQGYYLEVEL